LRGIIANAAKDDALSIWIIDCVLIAQEHSEERIDVGVALSRHAREAIDARFWPTLRNVSGMYPIEFN
jgi:hypothetical protein